MFKYRATYVRNYDGDTITFTIDLGFNIKYETNIRLKGIDTHELGEKDKDKKILAYKAKEHVFEKLTDAKEIVIETEKDRTGKYGRYIATVYYDGIDIGQELLELGLAEAYK